jgi:hypothetical protein
LLVLHVVSVVGLAPGEGTTVRVVIATVSPGVGLVVRVTPWVLVGAGGSGVSVDVVGRGRAGETVAAGLLVVVGATAGWVAVTTDSVVCERPGRCTTARTVVICTNAGRRASRWRPLSAAVRSTGLVG